MADPLQYDGFDVPPLIARVLADETYYRGGPGTWPNAPTSKDAKEARLRAIKRLRRFANDFAGAGQLADIIAGCKPHHRCMSGACTECTRAFRRWFVSEVQKIVGGGK
jgi:hypothetical protein